LRDSYTPRRKRLDLSRFDTMQMHVRHPLVAAWWAMSFGTTFPQNAGSYDAGVLPDIQGDLDLGQGFLRHEPGLADEIVLGQI